MLKNERVGATKAIAASAFDFLLSTFATPLMALVYSPAAYGVFGTITGVANMVGDLSFLSLHHAYLIEKSRHLRGQILRFVTFVVLLAAALCGLVGLSMASEEWLWPLAMLPALVLSRGGRGLVYAVAHRYRQFGATASARVLDSLISRGFAVALGYLSGGLPIAFLIAALLSNVGSTWVVGRSLGLSVAALRARLSEPSFAPLSLIYRYRDFVFLQTISENLGPVVMLYLQVLVLASFSPGVTGSYIFALSVSSIPSRVFVVSTAPIVLSRLQEIVEQRPQDLQREGMQLLLIFVAAAGLIYLPLMCAAPMIFSSVLGEAWVPASKIVQILAPFQASAFVAANVRNVFLVTRTIPVQFKTQLWTSLPMVLACSVIFPFVSYPTGIILLSILLTLQELAKIAVSSQIVHSYSRAHRLQPIDV